MGRSWFCQEGHATGKRWRAKAIKILGTERCTKSEHSQTPKELKDFSAQGVCSRKAIRRGFGKISSNFSPLCPEACGSKQWLYWTMESVCFAVTFRKVWPNKGMCCSDASPGCSSLQAANHTISSWLYHSFIWGTSAARCSKVNFLSVSRLRQRFASLYKTGAKTLHVASKLAC